MTMNTTSKILAPSPWQTLNGQGVRRIPTMRAKTHPEVKKKNTRKTRSTIRIATWNVNSMFEAGKIHNTMQEMDRLGICILGVSEMRWPDSGKMKIGSKTVYYSGNDHKTHWNGVGLILTQNIEKSVINFVPHSDRMLLVQLKGSPIVVNLIQVYAPTADKSEDEVEQFYDDLQRLLQRRMK